MGCGKFWSLRTKSEIGNVSNSDLKMKRRIIFVCINCCQINIMINMNTHFMLSKAPNLYPLYFNTLYLFWTCLYYPVFMGHYKMTVTWTKHIIGLARGFRIMKVETFYFFLGKNGHFIIHNFSMLYFMIHNFMIHKFVIHNFTTHNFKVCPKKKPQNLSSKARLASM